MDESVGWNLVVTDVGIYDISEEWVGLMEW